MFKEHLKQILHKL